jgi:hypothetical protein
MFFACVETASALTPLPDSSPGFFTGEWAGIGAQGAYCYLILNADGRGSVMIDNGSGDWLGARIKWRNRQQSLEIENIIPMPTSHQLRIMPLERFRLSTGFNQSLQLNWSDHSEGCYLQKIENTANHLSRVRSLMKKLPSPKRAQ